MKDAEKVSILGAGGHAKVVIGTLQAAGYVVEALFDDDPSKVGKSLLGCRVAGPLADFAKNASQGTQAIIAIGSNRRRQAVAERFQQTRWLTVVHPRADVHASVKLGPGTVVFSGSVIQPGASLGDHCIVNTAATIDHDGSLGDFVHLGPGCHLAGEVQLKEGVFLGVGAGISRGRTVGQWTTVGAGAIVIDDLAAEVVAVGVPARPARKQEFHEATD